MINAGIHDGDLIAIKKSGHAREGAIIVARVNNEVTVKRLRIGAHHVSLLPENDAYQPICVAPADLVVEGVFVGVVRQPRGLH
jgi:repressor LexA